MLMHLVGSFTSRGQRPEAGGQRPPASYRMLLENSMPTACYFQRNSWKFEGSLIEVIIDLWPLFWGIMMLKQQKKSICAASERLLHRWSKLSALLCLGRTYIFFDLDCPASVYCPASAWLSSLGLRPWLDNCQTLGKIKILSRQRNFTIELCHLLSKPSEAAQNIYSETSLIWKKNVS